jgi:hypothetical protein
MFCQACGSRNQEEARFCNRCGAPIAAPNTPGGPFSNETVLGMGPSEEAESEEGTSAEHAPHPAHRAPNVVAGAPVRIVGADSTPKAAAERQVAPQAPAVRAPLPPPSESAWRDDADQEDTNEEDVPDRDYAGADTYDATGTDGALPTAHVATKTLRNVAIACALMGLGALAMWLFTRPAAPAREERKISGETSNADAAVPAPVAPTRSPQVVPEDASQPTRHASSHESSTRDRRNEREAAASSPVSKRPTKRDTPVKPDTPDTPVKPDVPGAEPADAAYAERVRYAVRRYYEPRARECFDGSATADVVLNVRIGANGHVAQATAAQDSAETRAAAQCIAAQARSWQLPAPDSGTVAMQIRISR